MLLAAATNAAVPFLMSLVVETLETGGRGGGSLLIPLLLLITFAVRASADFVSVYGLGWLGRSVVRDLRAEMFEHYTELPVSYYDQHSSGALISRLTYNTEQVAEAISTVVVVGVRDTLTILVLIGAMIYFSPLLSAMVAVAAPIVAGLVALMSRAFRRYGMRIQTSMGDATRGHGRGPVGVADRQGIRGAGAPAEPFCGDQRTQPDAVHEAGGHPRGR